MKALKHRLGTVAGWFAVALLVTLSLPLVALAVVALRVVFLAAAVTVVVFGPVTYHLHPGFRGWVHRHWPSVSQA